MKIIFSFVLMASLLVSTSTSVFSKDKLEQAQEIEANISKRLDELVQKVDQAQKKRKQYFYCAQTPSFGGYYTYMSGIFIVEDTKEAPLRTLEKVKEYCEKEFKKNYRIVSVVIIAFNRIDQ